MPEFPDVEVYVEHVAARVVGHELLRLQVAAPFILRTVEPPASEFEGRAVREVRRLGKRIVLGFDDELFAVIHLMIAGRLHWLAPGAKLHKTRTQLALHFEPGILQLTEAGKKRRASLHLVRGEAALDDHDPGGLEPLELDRAGFGERLTARNHTLKRALTDPRIFSGIGNAYSDEILFVARLSPLRLTQKLDDDEIDRLFEATHGELVRWRDKLREEAGDDFLEKVTAFRPDMFVHGRYDQPCRVCETPIQRIKYADKETNYCPKCQNQGRLLADRGLSRLLKKDWPKTLEELEVYKRERR